MRRFIEATSLLILVTVTVLRPLVAETYDSAESSITAALVQVSDPTPVRTAVFDLLILLSGCGWLLSRALGPARRYRWTGLEWGTGLIVVAAGVSCMAAGNKRLAIGASLDWICLCVSAIVLVQLMHQRWQRRLLIAAIIASASVQAIECFDQFYFSFEDTRAQYESNRAQFWARQGVDLDSPKVELFERRMAAREASGFLSHSNVTGSYLVLCGFAALGFAFECWRRAGHGMGRLISAGAAAIAAVILAAVPLTRSLGALASALAGGLLWTLLRLAARWIGAHRAKALLLGWAVGIAGLLALVGHGAYFASVPHDALPFRWQYSLVFRWRYWATSFDLIADHLLTGVGRENFGRHYVLYKPLDSPEEIANPHNIFVQSMAEWGVLGLLGLVAMLAGASRVVAGAGPRVPRIVDSDSDPPGSGRVLAWAIVLGLTVTCVRLPLLGNADPNFVYYVTVTTAMIWLGAFVWLGSGAGLAAVGRRKGDSRQMESVGAAVGLFAFLVHDMINFAIFVPGAAATAFALLAVCVAERTEVEGTSEESGRGKRWSALAAGVAVTLLLALLAVRPVVAAGRSMERARASEAYLSGSSPAEELAYRYYLEAAEYDSLDPTPHVRMARWLESIAATLPKLRDEALPLAEAAMNRAVARDRFNVRHRRAQAQLYMAWGDFTGSAAYYEKAVAAARSAFSLYPLDPKGAATLGGCLAAAGRAANSRALLEEAVAAYARALAMDESRPEWERIRGFREREREEIHARMQEARELAARLR